jgi:hypothetical protein
MSWEVVAFTSFACQPCQVAQAGAATRPSVRAEIATEIIRGAQTFGWAYAEAGLSN